jgi:hypothetical protein
VRAIVVVLLCASSLAGCRDREPDRLDWLLAHFDAGAFAPKVAMDDRASLRQQLSGVYEVTDGTWAWTAPDFEVAVAPIKPTLRVLFFLTQDELAQHPQVTVRARVNSVELAPERYTTAGDHLYVRELDRRAIGEPLRVAMSVSPPFQPAPPDTRALGIILKWISVEGR